MDRPLSRVSAAGAPAAYAADCPGHPDVLGTSRTLVVDPHEHPRIGTMQYRETLPLKDHEVVLTFDDGPLPKYSNQICKMLDDECIKATFFIIGEQAKAVPGDGVRKLVAAGHTVGTHSMNHPLTFDRMPLDKAEAQINGGIEWTSAAMTDPTKLAPFFRIPGLMRAEGVEDSLDLARHPGLERRLPGRRLAARVVRPRLSAPSRTPGWRSTARPARPWSTPRRWTPTAAWCGSGTTPRTTSAGSPR